MKLISIVGASHQFMKAVFVSHQLIGKGIDNIIINAGPSFDDTFSQFLYSELGAIEPKYRITSIENNPGAKIAKIIDEVEKILIQENPDLLLSFGDSDQVFAGSVAASKQEIPVGHVEAGLRSYKVKVKEELNRVLIDRMSSILFCTDEICVDNLKREGFDNFSCNIYNPGDIMQDIANFITSKTSFNEGILEKQNIHQNYALATISSKENITNPRKLNEIVKALNQINKELKVVIPLHPQINKLLHDTGVEIHFTVLPPVNYFDMIELIRNCSIVLTDSGDVQKEAYFFRKRCVTLKKDTEWPELVHHGFNMLGSSDSEFILIAFNEMMNRNPDFSIELYGNGKASEHISNILKKWKNE